MNYFAVDVGGSSIKYAVMTEEMHFLKKGKAESRHLETPEQFIAEIKKLYEANGCCEGGIAVSFCGETNEKTGYLYSGGSYPYLARLNLKDMIEEACNTKASVENDGCCAGLAESRYGTLRGYQNAAVVVIGTGLGGAIILNGALYHGAHGYAGSASFAAFVIYITALADMQCPKITALFAGAAATAGAAANLRLNPLMHS